jgi:hypothetical protein
MHGQAEAQHIPAKPAAIEPIHRQTFEATVSYFMVILTVSWVLAPIREFCVRAGADPVFANLSQAGATLLVLIHAAGWVVRTFGVPPRLSLRLAMGFGAVVIFAACEALSALLLFGLNPIDLTSELIGPQGLVIALTMSVAAILPSLRSRVSEV